MDNIRPLLLIAAVVMVSACDESPSPELDGSISTDGGVARDVLPSSDAVNDVPLWDASPPDNGLPPIISNFRVTESEKDRIYFDSDKPITATNVVGFVVSNQTISSVVIVPNQPTGHYFVLNESLDYWDNNTIRYDGGGDLTDAASRPLVELTLSYVQNLIPEPTTTTERYVTVAAAGGGDGMSEGSAWTMEEAFANAEADMTIWIKAGDYGDLNLVASQSGEQDKPIKFIGYKSSPGDITSNYYDYGESWDTSEMPTLSGSSPTSGVAIEPNEIRYVVFRNLQIQDYSSGIQAIRTFNSHLVFDRINGRTFGTDSFDGASRWATFINFETKEDPGSSGNMPFRGNTDMKFIDIRCLNAALAAMYVAGDGSNLFEGCKTYNDRTTFPARSDYHIVFNGHNNILRNCHVENFNTTTDNGSTHGIGVRGSYNLSSTYNLIERSTAVNQGEGLYIRNFGSDYNVIKDCTISNNRTMESDPFDTTGGITIWGGGRHNIIERVTVSETAFAIVFTDKDEDGHPDLSLASDNIIRNCVFNKVKHITFAGTPDEDSTLRDNQIINCTFDDAWYIYRQYGDQSPIDIQNNEFINCMFTNVGRPAGGPVDTYGAEGFVFSNSNFFGNHDDWRVDGSGNTNADPEYVSATDFHLSSGSPTEVTEGGATNPNAVYDFDGRWRGEPYSIGAFEN